MASPQQNGLRRCTRRSGTWAHERRDAPGITGAAKPALINPAPIAALRDALEGDLATIRRLTPHSEVVQALQTVCKDLALALEAARKVDLWVSVDDVVTVARIPHSTVTRICRRRGQEVGASKVQGSWIIFWPAFETYLQSGDRHPDLEAT